MQEASGVRSRDQISSGILVRPVPQRAANANDEAGTTNSSLLVPSMTIPLPMSFTTAARTILPFLFIGVLVFFYSKRGRNRRRAYSLPPGPRPLPVLGNILDMTLKESWLSVTELAFQYGDVMCMQVLGKKIVYLNSAEAAADLLDKRGAIYSDRPRMVMAAELCGCDQILPFTSYGSRFRRQRKLMQTTLGSREIPNYHQWLYQQTQIFIHNLVANSSDYLKHIRRYSGGLALAVVYGYQVTSSEDEHLLLAEECLWLLGNRISGASIWMVDIFPVLKYYPSWLPGAGFQREAKDFRRKYERFAESPFNFAKTVSKNDDEKIRSFCGTFFQDHASGSLTAEQEDDIKWIANSMYAASADTTIASVTHFISAMIQNPRALEKAQREIDAVIPPGCLPNFSHRESLPYIECIFKEVLRWGVPVPLNLPHCVRDDDVYREMLIPKGSIIIANIWAIMRDESIYPDAHTFIPERFMEPVDEETERKRDPRNYVFGFGRRRCPGADLVDSSIWLLIASIVAALRISPALNSDGTINCDSITYDKNAFFRIPDSLKFEVCLREGYRVD